jgi:hypothetical protein
MGATQQALLMAGGAASSGLTFEFSLDFAEHDTSNVFVDACGNWDFTARTAVGLAQTSAVSGSSSGLVGRYFHPNVTEGTTAFIPVASGFELPDSDWTFGMWVIPHDAGTGGSSRFLMGNFGSTSADAQAILAIDSDNDQLDFKVRATGGAFTSINSHTFPANEWTLITCTLDRANDEIILRSRRASAGAVQKNTASFTDALFTGVADANFCINDALSQDNTYFTGTRAGVVKADQAFYLLTAITDDDFDFMFNGGAGRAFSEF